jgi:hypothetical protein
VVVGAYPCAFAGVCVFSVGFVPRNEVWPWQLAFLAIFVVHFTVRPVFYPTINVILHRGYGNSHFGRLYGLATTFNKTAILPATFGFG